jgi:hypothetical protein
LYWGLGVGRRRDELAVQAILVTFLSALHTIGRIYDDRDMRVLVAEGARDRALAFLARLERDAPYVEGSYLDRAVKDARRRIEDAPVPE